MRRTRAPDNVASLPAMSDTETGGYYTDGPPATMLTKDDANIIQEELVALATLKGASLDATGANRSQCASAVDAVLGIEARATEAAGVDTTRKLVVIASDDAEVGESATGVICAFVVASAGCAAKGFESAAIAALNSRAGKTDGTSLRVAVIACEDLAVEGQASAAIASGSGSVTGNNAAMLAVQGDGTGNVSGQGAAAVAAFNPDVSGPNSAIMATSEAATVSGSGSAVIGSAGSTVAGDGAATLAHFGGNLTANADNSAVVGGTTADIDAANAVVIGGTDNEIAEEGCVIIGSDNSQIPATTNNQNIVVVASKHCDPDLGTTEDYMLCGGYHATTDSAPTWRIESNGGTLHATNTTVQGLDYAEFLPNADAKAHEPGQLLALRGDGVTLATRGDDLAGAVSVTPTITGGDDSIAWHGRYVRDEWGAVVYESVEVARARVNREAMRAYKAERKALAEAESAAALAHQRARQAAAEARRWSERPGGEGVDIATPTSALEVAAAAHRSARAARRALEKPALAIEKKVVRVPKINPAYKPGKHVRRCDRPNEWTRVGLLGQIRVRVDESVAPDASVVAGDVPGVGTAGAWGGRGAQLRCLAITSPFSGSRGYAIALCLVR